jgi:predicted Zn-dependent protease
VRQRGHVYQLVAYSPARYYSIAVDRVAASIDSFSPLTDPEVLNVEASRIDVVQLRRAQTLGEFMERNPSVVPVEQLALINHLSGSSARLPAGSLIKRVVS